MLSEFECGSCGVKFVVAFTDVRPGFPVRYCVACGSDDLKCLGSSDEDMKVISKMRQEDIRGAFGVGQNVLVRCGKDWITREILGITVLRNNVSCPHCEMPLLGEPRFWFKTYGNVSLEDVMAVEDINPHKMKKSVIPGQGLVTAKEVKPE